MIQEIYPHVFYKEFIPRAVTGEDVVFVCREDTILLKVTEGRLHLPSVSELGVPPPGLPVSVSPGRPVVCNASPGRL